MSSRIGLTLSRYYSSYSLPSSEPYIEVPVTEIGPYEVEVIIHRGNRAPESLLIDIDTIPSGDDIQTSENTTIRLGDVNTLNLFQELTNRRVPTQPITPVSVEVDGLVHQGYEFSQLDTNYDLTTIGQLFHSVDEFNDLTRWQQLLNQVRSDTSSLNKNVMAQHWGLAFVNGMIRYRATVPDRYENYSISDRIIEVIDYIGDRDLGNNYWNVNRSIIGAVINFLNVA